MIPRFLLRILAAILLSLLIVGGAVLAFLLGAVPQ
jgi:hypothetical protein